MTFRCGESVLAPRPVLAKPAVRGGCPASPAFVRGPDPGDFPPAVSPPSRRRPRRATRSARPRPPSSRRQGRRPAPHTATVERRLAPPAGPTPRQSPARTPRAERTGHGDGAPADPPDPPGVPSRSPKPADGPSSDPPRRPNGPSGGGPVAGAVGRPGRPTEVRHPDSAAVRTVQPTDRRKGYYPAFKRLGTTPRRWWPPHIDPPDRRQSRQPHPRVARGRSGRSGHRFRFSRRHPAPPSGVSPRVSG